MKRSWKDIRKKFIPVLYIIGVMVVILSILDIFILPWYVQRGKVVRVPDVVGMKFEEAQNIIQASELLPKEYDHKMDKKFPVGTVIAQNPAAGTEVKPSRGVYLTISGGELLTTVPNVRGKSLRDATFNLEHCGLVIGAITYEPSNDIVANTIVSQAIAPGVKVHSGSAIDIVISQGKNAGKHLVPDIALKSYTEAEKKIQQDGFKIGKVTYQVSLDLLPNTVIEQYPHGGAMADSGQAIDLIIAQKSEGTPSVEY